MSRRVGTGTGRVAVALVASWLTLACGARAQDCRLPNMRAGTELKLPAKLDERTRLGLATSLNQAFVDQQRFGLPLDELEKSSSCRVGELAVGGEKIDLWTGPGTAPILWARRADGAVAYMAFAPSLEEGVRRSSKAYVPTSSTVGAPIYALTVARGPSWRYVGKLYEGLPPLDVAETEMALALIGEAKHVAAYHVPSATLSYLWPTLSNRNAVLPDPLPETALLVRGDGTFFEDVDAERSRMTAARFVCEAAFGEFARLDMMIVNATAEGRDQGCRYMHGASWISVFVTRVGEPVDVAVLRQVVADRYSRTAGGVPLQLKAPSMAASQAWRDAAGMGQALMMLSLGPWLVEVRATYVIQDHEKLSAAASEIAVKAIVDMAGS